MITDLMWKMFLSTGNIEYFMQYRDIKERNFDFYSDAGQKNVLDGGKWRTSKQKEWLSGKQ